MYQVALRVGDNLGESSSATRYTECSRLALIPTSVATLQTSYDWRISIHWNELYTTECLFKLVDSNRAAHRCRGIDGSRL